MSQPIDANWWWAFTFTGGDPNCVHEYDDDQIYDETLYAGKYRCPKCNCEMAFDVSDYAD